MPPRGVGFNFDALKVCAHGVDGSDVSFGAGEIVVLGPVVIEIVELFAIGPTGVTPASGPDRSSRLR